MEQPVQLLERLLRELGINPDVQGEEMWFLYSAAGCMFKGQAAADSMSASVELWLRHYPDRGEGAAELEAKLKAVNQNEAMMDSGIRWMRFVFTQDHLGFVAQLNQAEKLIDEETARRRIDILMKLVEAELPSLVAR